MRKYALLSVIAVLLFSAQVSAQKTAFINEAKILQALPGYAQAIQEIESVNKDFSSQIKTMTDDLQKREQDLMAKYQLRNTATLEEIESKFSSPDLQNYKLLEEEAGLLQKKADAKQAEYNQMYDENIGSLLKKVNREIVAYCKNNKIDMLLKLDLLNPAVAYYDQEKDVTDEIIKLISK